MFLFSTMQVREEARGFGLLLLLRHLVVVAVGSGGGGDNALALNTGGQVSGAARKLKQLLTHWKMERARVASSVFADRPKARQLLCQIM